MTLFLGYFIKDLRVNADVLGYLPDDDPAAVLFNQIGHDYGGNEMVLIGVEAEDVFDPDFLTLISQITDSVRTIPGVGYVTSLTNVIDIRSGIYGIEIGRLIDEYDIPRDQEILDSIRGYALSEPMYVGNLVSADATATLVVAKILGGANRAEVVTNIRDKLKGISYGGQIYYGGMPVTLLELSKVIIHDIRMIAPIAFVLICLVLFAGFRNLRGVALPMISVLIAIIWTMGLISMLGFQITLLTNVVPVILLAVGSAYTIHVINAFHQTLVQQPAKALLRAMVYVSVPVFLASFTTIFGFLSFIAGSYLTMIREFGIFTAGGIVFSLALSLLLIPALLSFVQEKPGHENAKTPGTSIISHLTDGITYLVFRRRRMLFLAWLMLLMLSIWGISRIERRVDLVDYFRKDNIVQKSESLFKSKFNGTMPLYIHFEGDMQSREVLTAMQEIQEFMKQFPYIPYSQSVADLIMRMHDAMGEGHRIPDDQDRIMQLWFLLEGQEVMDQLVDPGLNAGIIQGYVSSTDLEVLREIEINFHQLNERYGSETMAIKVTGIPVMFKRLDDSIIKSQTSSLIIALVLVLLLVSLLQHSWLKGVMAIIPIFVTLLILFGTMGITGIPLDIATVLTGSVTIGIGIDYAIHFMSYFGKVYGESRDLEQGVKEAIRVSGKAILINMIAVSLGFAVLLLSNLVPLQRFGFLIAVTMIISGLAALTLLPIVMLVGGTLLKKIFVKINTRKVKAEGQRNKKQDQ